MPFEMYENQPFKNLLLRNLKFFLQGLFLNSFSQNCECARMQYLEHYVCSGIELAVCKNKQLCFQL